MKESRDNGIRRDMRDETMNNGLENNTEGQSDVLIEKYHSDNYGAVKKILSYVYETKIDQKTLEEKYIDSSHFIFVAKHAGRDVIGCVLAEKRNDYVRNSSFIYITYLAVHHDFRGKGIGRLLVERIEKMCVDMNCSAIELTSANFRVGTHCFYKALGYTVKKTTHFIKELSVDKLKNKPVSEQESLQ